MRFSRATRSYQLGGTSFDDNKLAITLTLYYGELIESTMIVPIDRFFSRLVLLYSRPTDKGTDLTNQ